jgi:hypothetical protein
MDDESLLKGRQRSYVAGAYISGGTKRDEE